MATATTIPVSVVVLFGQLADRWRAETLYLSDSTAIAMHPAYQRIIGLGPVVLPLILAELAKEPDHWFWALRALTGENPVPAEASGRIREMADAWLAWSRERDFVAGMGS